MARNFASSDIGAFMAYLSESDEDSDSVSESDIVLDAGEDYSRYSSETDYSGEEEDSDSEQELAEDEPGPSSRSTCARDPRIVRTSHKSSSDNGDSSEGGSSHSEQSDQGEEEPRAKRAKRAKRRSEPERKWSNTGRFMPKVLKSFDSTQCGIQPSYQLPADAKESEYFTLLFDCELASHVCKETNKYANALIADPEYKKKAGLATWTDCNIGQIYTFIGVVVLMSLISKKRMVDYWSKDVVLYTPYFGKVMGRNSFFQILKVLHFVDNSTSSSSSEDRVWKVRPILDGLVDNFTAAFKPYKDLCIDESLLLWKGRLFFKQYIPSKRNRFGVKLYVLCDAYTRYILKFFVYSGGKEIEYTHNDALGKSGSIVTSLLDSYLEKGHVIYVDNFYSSPALFGHLFSKETGACGTVRPNRKEMPKFTKKLKKGEIDCFHSDELLALTWHDKRDVRMLSTVHTPVIVETNKVDHKTKEKIRKPQCVVDYIKSMGAVDKSDMQISLAECVRKTRKWYKSYFFT